MLRNVVYNSLVLRFLKGRPGKEKKNLGVDVIRFRKLNTQTTKSVYNMFKSKEMLLSMKCQSQRECLKTCSSILVAHKQTKRLLSPYFSHENSFVQRRRLDVYCVDLSVSRSCVMCWTCSLSGLHHGSTSTARSDPHPKADNPFVDFSVNQSCIFQSSLFEFNSNRLDS